MWRRRWLVMGLLLGVCWSSFLAAKDRDRENRAKSRSPERPVTKIGKTQADTQLPITEEMETAALTFAKEHHSELSDLLEKLKKGKRAEYERAIRQLVVVEKHLAGVRKQSPSRYETSRTLWSLNSKIRLVAARMTKSKSADSMLEAELHGLVSERLKVKVDQMREQREALAKQIAALQKDLDLADKRILDVESDHEAAVQADIERVKRGAERSAEKRFNLSRIRKGPRSKDD